MQNLPCHRSTALTGRRFPCPQHIFVLEGAVEEVRAHCTPPSYASLMHHIYLPLLAPQDNSETIDKSTGGRKYDTSGVSYDRGVIGF
jgi:hypothetical protein